jgi:imidazole glycerol-phosphate synthase subunit HisH
MISIIDYGLGNILALANIFKKLNISVEVVTTPEQLQTAERIILPGVGSFDWAISRLNDSGMRSILEHLVLEKKIPVLGICVGMQMMANRSDEGKLKGLGWIDADVRKFDVGSFVQSTHLPHMGWNDVTPVKSSCLFSKLERDARFYFLHSYYFSHNDQNQVLAQTDYNGLFASSVYRENVYGVQFHPEKSHQWGIQLLKNFAEL